MITTSLIYRRYKQVVEAGIVSSDEERFTVSEEKLFRLLDVTKAQFEEVRKINSEEKDYLIETSGSDFVFRRPSENS